MERDLIEHVLATSDPTLRAVFAEDAAALVGLILAAAGLAARQVTGVGRSGRHRIDPHRAPADRGGRRPHQPESPVPDRAGSRPAGPGRRASSVVGPSRGRAGDVPRLEVVGPQRISVIGDVDLTGDDPESHVAVRLRALEAKISSSPAVVGAVLSLSAPDETSLS
jgi:hypothetical protein